MNIPDEAIEAVAKMAYPYLWWQGGDAQLATTKAARNILRAAAPFIAAQVSADVTRLARWLMDADITESLEVLDILAEGDLSKAITRIDADS